MSQWAKWIVWPLLAAGAATAQQAGAVPPDASVTAALVNLSVRAGTAFVGQVTGIQHNAGVVDVQFRVEEPVLGTAQGTYTLREWAGLWPQGQTRYRLGEHVLVFLHGASSVGLSSAVDGREGVVPVLADASGKVLLDVRRLGTRVRRQVGDPLPDLSDGAIALADALPVIRSRTMPANELRRRALPKGVTPIREGVAQQQQVTRIGVGRGPIEERMPDAQ